MVESKQNVLFSLRQIVNTGSRKRYRAWKYHAQKLAVSKNPTTPGEEEGALEQASLE